METFRGVEHLGPAGPASEDAAGLLRTHTLTWDVELRRIKPVEFQVEAQVDDLHGDQAEQVDHRQGPWREQKIRTSHQSRGATTRA